MKDLRIKKIIISNLFGMFDHEINLNINEKITIIHGPNGVGKTTILKIIHDLFQRNFYKTIAYPFKFIELFFSGDQYIKITKIETDDKRELNIKYRIKIKEKTFKIDDLDSKYLRRFPTHIIDEFIPSLDRIGSEKWIDRTTGELLTFSDIVYRFGDDLPFSEFGLDITRIPKEFQNLLTSQSVHFIQTQRLFVDPDPEEIRHRARRKVKETTIENYSNEMVAIIKEIVRESGNVSASLDRTFPNRLLTAHIPKNTTESLIREQYISQNNYRNRLMNAGLIEAEDPVALPDRELNTNDLKVLLHYLHDVEQKFNVYDDVLKKIELFKDIINSRFLYKKFFIDKNDGFVFKSDVNQRIPLKTLSSGEQHEVVLAFELIFKVKKNSLILIDEPELSLHVTWQHKFLDDLERISAINHMDFIIATHSPSIVQNRRSLMVTIPRGVTND